MEKMQEFNLGKLVRYYLKYSWIIIAALLLGAGVGLFYSKNFVRPEYKSESTVILNQHSGTNDATLINNYTTLLKSRKVLEPIMSETASDMSYSELYENISIVNQKSTEIITISVTAGSPETAQDINSRLVESFNLESLGLAASDTNASSQIITVIDEASYSPGAVNNKTVQNVIILAGGGAVVAAVVLFVVFDVQNSRAARTAVSFANRRRSRMVGAITVDERPQIIAAEISKEEQKAREEQSNRIRLIKREATDILDVLENIGGVELRH